MSETSWGEMGVDCAVNEGWRVLCSGGLRLAEPKQTLMMGGKFVENLKSRLSSLFMEMFDNLIELKSFWPFFVSLWCSSSIHNFPSQLFVPPITLRLSFGTQICSRSVEADFMTEFCRNFQFTVQFICSLQLCSAYVQKIFLCSMKNYAYRAEKTNADDQSELFTHLWFSIHPCRTALVLQHTPLALHS